MRTIPAVAAMILLIGTAAAAPPPIYIKRSEVTVLVAKGEGHHAVLDLGYNIVGEQHPIQCPHDAGCLMTIASMVEINDVTGSWAICTLVDGVATTPHCPHQNPASGREGGVGNALASVLLTEGRHMVETGVYLKDSAGAHLGVWEVHYTTLDDPPAGK